MTQQVAVIDYGMGNIHSIDKALKFVSPQDDIQVVHDAQQIANADRVVFPGVGAIRDCMTALKESGLGDAIRKASQEKPLLAICVGMQALFQENEEHSASQGLGILAGEVKRLHDTEESSSADGLDASKQHKQHKQQGTSTSKLKIPHIGWNNVSFTNSYQDSYQNSYQNSYMWSGIEENSYFYFVHSYYCVSKDMEISSAKCHYGVDFDAAVQSGNIFATQFHPEKSHKDGLQLLKNFFQWKGSD